MYQDTIVAVSTPVGEGGIGIVRLSGERSRDIAGKLFDRELSNRKLVHGRILDPDNGRPVDDVLVSFMAAPHTYTREDVVEINCHGGVVPLRQVLGLCLKYGARLAEPGEFTLRAFINGRVDLAQAEAVLDVIRSRTDAGLRVAMHGLSGELSAAVKAARAELVSTLAHLTAGIDFPDDDIGEGDTGQSLESALTSLDRLIESAHGGMVYRQGVRTAIAGKPNVGKSSLLNRLLGQDRAIVTSIAGTTRDTIEETLDIKGVPFVLIDTAGIAKGGDAIESLGIERSRRALGEADLVLFVIDSSEPVDGMDEAIAGSLDGKNVLLVANKCDLPTIEPWAGFRWERVSVSALTGEGMAALREAMLRKVLGGELAPSDRLMVSNPRHKAALEKAKAAVVRAQSGLREGTPADLVTIDITAAIEALGEITGETVRDDLLEAVFSRFCIGK